ncbi:glutaredoxin [Azovibrio restrictus]|uniref:glutaredoxin family protein n=1 Tax=Azovibrio restrictus TaxID=146938 RepID=UPI0026EA5BFD|nr:glutaredoxin [Azovibrio restrictus]
MRWLIRSFFKTLRVVIGPFLLLNEKISAPKGLVRSPEAQAAVDAACRQLALYQFKTCPFCIKVRQQLRRLSLNIELRDAQFDAANRAELEQGGGKVMVPCLKITGADGQVEWLYESERINAWLQERFPG